MSTLEHDGFVIESSNPDVAAVTANLDATTPAPVGETARPETSAVPADAANGGPSSETPEAPEPERSPDGKFARKGSIQERIDKAVAAQRTAERERDALKAQMEARQAPAAPEPVQPAAPTFDPSQGPQLDQFDSYEAWVDARAEWKADQAWQRIQAAQQQDQALRTHTERIHAYAAKAPDYFEKIAEASALPVSKVMEAAIIASDRGPELAYFLATHPEEGIRLAQQTVSVALSQAPLVRELLESKLVTSQAASSGPAAGVSRQPVFRPIKPVGATPVVAETPPDDLEFGPEYVRRMNERDRQRRRL